ncbi:hypothetical protein HYPSUDRAFT_202049 [Hypholoma sublateritium FD-334 SS-4]|uniref:Uncharacterized protein n=1 Tax=Hypholoma sublateritium (strain FD-334 SS-4) TaxID=945553 RepID=A0A0D2NUB2_HYPSF|nr:hypothetical protein HYPSUDRAFT_202049 [Hypholoma sublateritium FD-334 SS-4]
MTPPRSGRKEPNGKCFYVNALVTNEPNTLKAEPVAPAVPEPAAETNDPGEHTKSETEDDIDGEDYLDQIFAKVHDLLVLLRNSRSKGVARRRQWDKQLRSETPSRLGHS